MPQTLLSEDWQVAEGFQIAEAFKEEYEQLKAWGKESRKVTPYVDLAVQWYGGLLPVREGKRIEVDYRLWELYGGLG